MTTLPFDYKKIQELSGRGLTATQIAHCIGISKTTIYAKMQEDPKLKEAIDNGKSKVIAAVTGKLLKKIEEGNLTAMIFFLKCQAGWKETSVVETKPYEELPEEYATVEDAAEAYRSITH